jgi:hypothetical protein
VDKNHLTYLPNSEEFHEEVIGEAGEKHLADDVGMGSERRLEHDRHVRSVEQLDGL